MILVLKLAFPSAVLGQRSALHASGPCQAEDLAYEQGFFYSGGKLIHVEEYRPKAAKRYPTIIMIHGSAGLLTRQSTDLPSEDNFGEKRIACGGYFVLLVHFFDRSGILSTVDKQYMVQQSDAWLETLRKAVDYASSLANVNPTRIGLLGESLGGYLALSLAMSDSRIKAVSEYGGGIRLREGDDPRKLPPVLIQHGSTDSIVPVTEAQKIKTILAEAGVKCWVKIYEGINHYPGSYARAEIEEQSVQFFDDVLKAR